MCYGCKKCKQDIVTQVARNILKGSNLLTFSNYDLSNLSNSGKDKEHIAIF